SWPPTRRPTSPGRACRSPAATSGDAPTRRRGGNDDRLRDGAVGDPGGGPAGHRRRAEGGRDPGGGRVHRRDRRRGTPARDGADGPGTAAVRPDRPGQGVL